MEKIRAQEVSIFFQKSHLILLISFTKIRQRRLFSLKELSFCTKSPNQTKRRRRRRRNGTRTGESRRSGPRPRGPAGGWGEPRWQRLVSIITLRNRRIFQLSTYHELQLEEISGLVRFFFIEVKVRFLNSVFKFAEAEWGVSRSPAGSPGSAGGPRNAGPPQRACPARGRRAARSSPRTLDRPVFGSAAIPGPHAEKSDSRVRSDSMHRFSAKSRNFETRESTAFRRNAPPDHALFRWLHAESRTSVRRLFFNHLFEMILKFD